MIKLVSLSVDRFDLDLTSYSMTSDMRENQSQNNQTKRPQKPGGHLEEERQTLRFYVAVSKRNLAPLSILGGIFWVVSSFSGTMVALSMAVEGVTITGFFLGGVENPLILIAAPAQRLSLFSLISDCSRRYCSSTYGCVQIAPGGSAFVLTCSALISRGCNKVVG